MKKLTLTLGLGIILGLTACNEEMLLQDPMDPALQTTLSTAVPTGPVVCGSLTFPLTAGQTINAGSVVVSNDASNLYVSVTSTEGFQNVSENIKMWLGTDLTLVDGGGTSRPAAGKFPYKTTVTSGNTFTFTVPLAGIPFYNVSQCGVQTIYVLVHADVLAKDVNGVVSEETAWGGKVPGLGRAWWFYDLYTPACCTTPPPVTVERLGTAFAKGTWVFTTDKKSNPENLQSLKLTKNRWGWAINLTSPGTTTYDVFVGAGLNFTSKGIKVGTATIAFDGTNASVTYDLDANYLLEEVHVYAGDMKPTTIAPGQYGFLNYFDPLQNDYSVTLPVSDTNGDGVWLILHGVVWGPNVTNPL